MRGRAGARSTQARTPTCRSPPTGAPPSPQPFTGCGFSGTLIALLSSYLFFCTWLQGSGASGALEALPGLECSTVLGFRHGCLGFWGLGSVVLVV